MRWISRDKQIKENAAAADRSMLSKENYQGAKSQFPVILQRITKTEKTEDRTAVRDIVAHVDSLPATLEPPAPSHRKNV